MTIQDFVQKSLREIFQFVLGPNIAYSTLNSTRFEIRFAMGFQNPHEYFFQQICAYPLMFSSTIPETEQTNMVKKLTRLSSSRLKRRRGASFDPRSTDIYNLPLPVWSNAFQVFSKFVSTDFTLDQLVLPSPPFNSNSPILSLGIIIRGHTVAIGGRYCKLIRGLAHSTPPFSRLGSTVQSRSLYDSTSVSDILGPPEIADIFQAASVTIVSSGREDTDVRMIGSGRPFIIRVHSPKLPPTAKRLQQCFELSNQHPEMVCTGKLAYFNFQELSSAILRGEKAKRKIYSALVYGSKPIVFDGVEPKTPLEIQQWTPVRTTHRRNNVPRTRTIFNFSFDPVPIDFPFAHPDHFGILSIETQAGTYIKEFVSGDFSRTTPNLSSLYNNRLVLVALDVVDIQFNLPKPIPPVSQEEED